MREAGSRHESSPRRQPYRRAAAVIGETTDVRLATKVALWAHTAPEEGWAASPSTATAPEAEWVGFRRNEARPYAG